MANTPEMFAEFVFQARLKFLAFRRFVVMYESAMVLAVLFILLLFDAPPWVVGLALALVLLRWYTELLNYHRLAREHGMQDVWPLLYPFQ